MFTLVSSTFRDSLEILQARSSFSSLPELASTSVTNDDITGRRVNQTVKEGGERAE